MIFVLSCQKISIYMYFAFSISVIFKLQESRYKQLYETEVQLHNGTKDTLSSTKTLLTEKEKQIEDLEEQHQVQIKEITATVSTFQHLCPLAHLGGSGCWTISTLHVPSHGQKQEKIGGFNAALPSWTPPPLPHSGKATHFLPYKSLSHHLRWHHFTSYFLFCLDYFHKDHCYGHRYFGSEMSFT